MKKKLNTLLQLVQLRVLGYFPGYPILKRTDTCKVEILADKDFQQSCREVNRFTCLDTPRLANLWNLCRHTNPQGGILEVGSFRGGGALHLSNSSPGRRIILCDSFEGFELLDPVVDRSFSYEMFKNTSHQNVDRLFAGRELDYKILAGFFPAVCQKEKFDLGRLSFVHLDVDAYKPTIESLEYLDPFMMERSLMVLDDYHRETDGVTQAVREFTSRNRAWTAFPLFPAQGLLVHESWFDKNGPPLSI